MTAEIAIINQHGIAIAADSAVTIGKDRVWKSTNKVFSLGPKHDIVVMIYGGASYSSYPWETVVKSFKHEYCDIDFESVEECVNALKAYLHLPIWEDKLQSELCILGLVIKEISELRDVTKSDSKAEFRKLCKAALTEWSSTARDSERVLVNVKKEDFLKEFRKEIDQYRAEYFTEHFPKYLSDLLDDYLYEYVTRANCESGSETGIVVSGFGKSEFHPQLHEFFVDGRYGEHVRCWDGRISRYAITPTHPAQIIPFAQKDMTNLFMEGLSPAYLGYINGIVSELLERRMDDVLASFQGSADAKLVERKLQERINSEIFSRIGADVEKFRDRFFIHPLMANVRNLPREEMAAMAEALVELTSLRRKIDSTLQSVAGPVDVVFISKADGVVWIKRKHYFDPKLNREFLQRRPVKGEER